MLNLNSFLSYNARNHPYKIAFIQGDQFITYAELEKQINKVANGLVALGIQPGDKIAVSCPNRFYFPIINYGALKIGAIAVPFSILLKAHEISHQLKHSDSKVYFCYEDTPQLSMGTDGIEGFKSSHSCTHFISIPVDVGNPQHIEGYKNYIDLIEGQSDEFTCYPTTETDTAIILYTSGTTADPKGVEISHSAIVWNARACLSTFRGTVDDIILTALPLFHIFGYSCNMNAAIMGGLTNVLLERFNPVETLKAMYSHKVNILTAVPTMFWQLVHSGRTEETKDLIPSIKKNIRLCAGGAAKVPPQLSKDFQELFGIKIYEGMGISESAGIVSLCDISKEPILGSIGIPIVGTEFKIITTDFLEASPQVIGELCIRGVSVMKGYYKNPEATLANFLEGGWFRTGDLAYIDEHGNYFLVDRIKDLIIRGGRNIYPKEIEEVLMTHPAISMVAVIGIPDQQYGEEVKAFIVLKPHTNLSEHDLNLWARKELSAYKYPRIISFVDSLPLTASGKIAKKELKAREA